jgi:CelD/BcsL family acetyltransferase involved in cellulose biosynthesis
MSALSVSLITTEERFHGLRDTWNVLAASAGGAIFLHHEWFDAAWEWRKENASLFVLVAWEAEKAVGVLPLIAVREPRRFGVVRRLEFLTVPDTQFCDLIAAPEDRSRVAEIMCAELHRRRTEWDRLMLRYLPKASAAHELKAALAARDYAVEIIHQDHNLFVPLESSWDAYYTSRSRSLKKANNLAANRLKKTGAITIECVSADNGNSQAVDDALERAVDISRRSWKHATGNSLDHSGPNRFIRTLTTHAVSRRWLMLWLLAIDGRPVAMEYELVDNANIYALRADFDAAFEEVSPGSHLMRTLLESFFGTGMKRYYMGPGENAYKTRWTEEFEPLDVLLAYGRTSRGRILRLVDDVLKPLARSIRDTLTPDKAGAGLPKK